MKKQQQSLYDYYRERTRKAFNFPSIKMVSDGDILTFLKAIK
jgi:hypothetical protein